MDTHTTEINHHPLYLPRLPTNTNKIRKELAFKSYKASTSLPLKGEQSKSCPKWQISMIIESWVNKDKL